MSSPVTVQGTPVVVQGTPVSNQSYPTSTTTAPAATTPTNFSGKGEKQETKCRDPIFAILFYVAVICIIVVAVVYGPDAMDTPEGNFDYTGVVVATVIIAVLSFLGAGAGFSVMLCIPETLIKVALIFVVVLAGVWMVMAFASGQVMMGILGAVFFAINLCYAKMVWSRIPFATANLVTACTAIKHNLGVTVYAYLFTALAAVWSICWSIAFVGTFNRTYECDEQNVCTDPSYGLLFLLFICYFFVHQVLQNSIHVTVAGMLGHWWFEPDEASTFCSEAVNNAFLRTVTTSFGSICFGSLIVAILQALRMLANVARDQDDGILLCLAECILACIASIVEYFNKWAFIYVGLYGYSYMDAGKNVFTMFRNRGWEAVIADDLVSNTLFLLSVMVGGVMGAIAVIIERSSDLFEDVGGNATGTAFLLGFVVGMVITSVIMSTIGSGVNAVLVLFAESPAEFQQNHPALSNRMRQVWSEVYPGSV